jgi:hypothetical protein
VDTVRILNKCLNRESSAMPGIAQGLVAHLKHCAISLVKLSTDRETFTGLPNTQSGSRMDAKPGIKIDKSLLIPS